MAFHMGEARVGWARQLSALTGTVSGCGTGQNEEAR